MKRTLKLLALILIGTIFALNFASCGGGSDASGDEKTGDNNNEQGNEWQQPAFYIDEELGGQQFVNRDTDLNYYNLSSFNQSYKDAQKFMTKKVNELSEMVTGQTDVALYQEIDDALKNMNQGDNIGDNVQGNYTALATVFADLEKNHIYTDDNKKYNNYKCSYYKLAHKAYNESLPAEWHNNTGSFPANAEMRTDTNSFFVQQLAYSNYNYDSLTVDEAKNCMNNTMNDIAYNTGVDSTVLKKFVELALYNESLYGLNDVANGCNLDVIRINDRHANTFDGYIRAAKNNMQNYTLDDRTM